MSCCKCGKESWIHVISVGEFCCDCFNRWAKKTKGIPDPFVCPEVYQAEDPIDGVIRTFQLGHLNWGNMTSWIAKEEPDGYEISHVSYPDEDPNSVVQTFLEKIDCEVKGKVFSEKEGLKMKGSMFIVYDEEDGTALEIDGKRVSFEELAQMLSCYEGWQMHFMIRDHSDRVLNQDELLLPVNCSRDALMEELEQIIGLLEDGSDFIGYSSVSIFDAMFSHVMEKLELALDYAETHTEAIETAKLILKRMEQLETDDDYFPLNWTEKLEMLIRRNEAR